ncbi:GerMN domain-containing protein [Clostridium estertheticum]|uniref:GerMN domain-containing protein n=1 Tax=Clostridium estertheticum TaxID=238834 RepID=UPI0013E9267D|nr:GerMN domain-containing protein [Clostridium estertheticum]MBZ9688428.1 GerMN domain-containing protein [Clostridium estertheticum]
MKKILSVILCSVLMFTLVACGKSEAKKEDTSKSIVKEEPVTAKVETKVEPKTEEIKSSEVVLYFSDDQAMNLVGVKRNLQNATAKSIVGELVKGPNAQSEGEGKLIATLPVDLEIIDVQVKENIAYVDFKSSATQKISAGSTGEGMALFSIINTLVLDKELGIKKVQFLVEGKNVESIKGHFDVSKPMSENIEMIKK